MKTKLGYNKTVYACFLGYIVQAAVNNLFLRNGDYMKIVENPDKKIADKIKEGLKKNDGYCPCRIGKSEKNKCMCEEFKKQIADENFEGFCHCMLYYKYK